MYDDPKYIWVPMLIFSRVPIYFKWVPFVKGIVEYIYLHVIVYPMMREKTHTWVPFNAKYLVCYPFHTGCTKEGLAYILT